MPQSKPWSVKLAITLPACGQKTISVDEVSTVFREPFIVRGYRLPNRCWSYYLDSLFQLHNETVNIWSHLVAFVLFAYKVYSILLGKGYLTETALCDSWNWPILGFALGTMCYAGMSSAAHLFHSKSELDHYMCFQIDYIGVAMNVQGTGILLYYFAGSESFHRTFGSLFLVVNALNSVLVCVCCGFGKLLYRRPYPPQRALWILGSCACAVGWAALPLFCRAYDCLLERSSCSLLIFLPHLHYTFWAAMSTVFYASRLPERLSPGTFDYLGHGHQVFHVAMTIATLLQYSATVHELQTRGHELRRLTNPDGALILVGQFLVVTCNVIFVVFTSNSRTWAVSKIHDN